MQFIPDHRSLHAQPGKHLQDGLTAVAFLSDQPSNPGNHAFAGAERGQHGNNREDIRRIVQIHRNSLQGRAGHAHGSVHLRNHGPGLDQDIRNRKVCLQGGGIQPGDFGLAKERAGHQEGRRAAPVAFDVEVGRVVLLPAADLEGHASASAPILLLQHLLIPLHLGGNLDAKVLEHVAGDEHVGDALGVGDDEGGWLVEQRQRGQQAGDQLRAVLAGDLRHARDDAAVHAHGHGALAHYHPE